MAERRPSCATVQAKRPEPLKRSKRVKRILQLEGHAARCRADYEQAMTRIAPHKHRAEELRQQAMALKVRLSAHELHELRRARSGV